MNKILVTGGTGYIGSHTVLELINEGYEVVVVDNLSNSNEQVLNSIRQITGKLPAFFNFDLCDKNAVKEFANKNQDIAGIIHFAAFKSVNESVEKPLLYYQNNLESLTNLLEEFPKVNFIFSSSCTVYGQPDNLPVTELSAVQKAESPYGNTKQIAEEILADLSKVSKELKVIALRYFNPVGAHDSALIGELPNGIPQNLVPFITQSAARIRGAITVHGTDYPTKDGSAVRDYIHVVDVAKAHIAALKKLEENKITNNFSVYNIGTGTGYSVLEVINAFEHVTNQKLNYKIGPRRVGDIAEIYGDTSKSNKELGWRAAYNLNEMLLSAWKWQQHLGSIAK